jgi:hypothetical protein
VLYGGIVNQQASLQVVCAVKYQRAVGLVNEMLYGLMVDIGYDRCYLHLRIYVKQFLGGGLGLWQVVSGIGFIEKDLSLQVAKLYAVAVNYPQPAYACSCHHTRQVRA